MLQPLEAHCRPATLPSWGHRWGAAGALPSPRAGRQTGVITWWAARSGGLALRRGDRGRSMLQCCNRPGPLLASDGTELESLVGQGFTL